MLKLPEVQPWVCGEGSAPAASVSSRRCTRYSLNFEKFIGTGVWCVSLGDNAGATVAKSVRCAAGRSSGAIFSSESAASPTTAKRAVELGLSQFAKGRVRDALTNFNSALVLDPEPEEAQAALYNKACCHAVRSVLIERDTNLFSTSTGDVRREGDQAAQALRIALKDYGLKFSVILNDPDMAAFRAMPQFKELQDEARKGGEDVGNSFRRDLKLISEVQAPFRGVRKFFYVGFSLAAGIGTLFTVPRLIQALQGGDGAPSLSGTAQNLAINLGGIAVFVALLLWDNRKEEEQIVRISRDETLSRLLVQLQSDRIVELSQLRESTRPVIIAGSKDVVDKTMLKASRIRDDLLKRGILLIPIVWGSTGESTAGKRKGFGSSQKPTAPTVVSVGDDFEKKSEDIAAKAVIQAEKKFKAEPVSFVEWERWIRDQQQAEGVTPGEDVFIILRLDGRVRKSGRGMPNWPELLDELPTLDSLASKLEK